MENKFADIMSKRTNGELIEIVTKLRNDYQAEAVLAAEFEIKKRNLSTEQLEKANDEVRTKERNLLEKEIVPLGIVQKIMFFIFFWGIIPWAIAATFNADGYTKKCKDAWRFMKYGLLSFIGINALIVLFLIISNKNSIEKLSSDNQAQTFREFIKKFKKIDLPFVYHDIFIESNIDFSKMEEFDINSSDTLFFKKEYSNGVKCYGILSDTTNFFALIFIYPADNYYPILATYDKKGSLIDQEGLIVHGCGGDCGLEYCSSTAIINKDFSIFCADTIKWEYSCDSLGNPIPDSDIIWVDLKTGKLKNNGKINVIEHKRKEFKGNR